MNDPTAALLWAACRPAADHDLVAAALDRGANVALAADIAVAQRVSPLLHRALTGTGAAIPEALARDAARVHAQSRMLLTRVGTLAFAPLAAADVVPLVIKGAALAGRYEDPGLRPMDDVDVVLPHDQIDPAIGALVAASWEVPQGTDPKSHEVGLVHRQLPGLHVDLHRRLGTWRTRANRLTSSVLWDGRRRDTLFGEPVFTLPPALEFVMLASHAAKPYHVFDRLLWSVDFAVVVSQDSLDWDEVARIARAVRCETAVAVALAHAARLGASSPPELRQISPRRQRALAPLLSPDWPVLPRHGELRAQLRDGLVDDLRFRVSLTAAALTETPLRTIPRRVATRRTRRRTHRPPT